MTLQLSLPHLDLVTMGNVPLFTDDALFEACGTRIAFAGRGGGASSGVYESLNTASHVDDDPMSVARNRRILLDAIGAHGAPLIVPEQVHGTTVARIAAVADIGRVSVEVLDGADAVQSDVPGIAVLLNTADCLPLIVVAPSGRFVVVHAGWRGALARIASKAADSLAQAGFDEDPSMFNAYIGPHIGVECFEVSEEIANSFADEFGSDVVEGSRNVNLSSVIVSDLESAGVLTDRIADCGICTVCQADEYFSYRASGGSCGRQAVVAYRPWE